MRNKTYKPQIRTKNYSADDLKARNAGIGEFSVRSVIRFGSRTTTAEAFPNTFGKRTIVEVNTPEACHNSGDKILMKRCFTEDGVTTAPYAVLSEAATWDTFPAIIKHRNSCKGQGIYYVETKEELDKLKTELKPLGSFIIEKYLNYPKEYRLHVTKDGCFYTCRKMLKSDATDRWHRHDSNSVWIMEENVAFDKPKNWDAVVAECVKALKSCKLDVGACDVKIQSEKGSKLSSFVPDFIVLEINSAPSFGAVTLEKYRTQLPIIIQSKINELK